MQSPYPIVIPISRCARNSQQKFAETSWNTIVNKKATCDDINKSAHARRLYDQPTHFGCVHLGNWQMSMYFLTGIISVIT